jgi:formylglycine-generating enzyme required for sulfatase activity
MKEVVFVFLFLVLSVLCAAQKVSNIRAEQRGQDVVVLYSLETNSPCEVSLLLSQDNGRTWGAPLKRVSGDIGRNISEGDKEILWKVLEERENFAGEMFKFKIVAVCKKKSFEPEMIFVEGGTFQMGSNSGAEIEKPIHQVTLSSFNIGKYEVTQAQWKAVMGKNPSKLKECDNCPVDNVSWNDVQDFLNKLNEKTVKNYRLPSEAEWEYAARGGNRSQGYLYSGSNDINKVACYGNISDYTDVGLKQANELGIYDMSGNIAEWCADFNGAYSNFNQENPTGDSWGYNRVVRGGCWNFSADECRVSRRSFVDPDYKFFLFGFRVVLPSGGGQ